MQANLAALRTGQVDGMVGPMEVGFHLEERHEGRIAVHLAQYAPHFHAHILFATKKLIAEKPDVLERFLKGFFAAVKVMKTDKKTTSEAAVRVLHSEPSIADRTYDAQVGMLIDDGHFDPQAIKLIKEIWVELGMLDKIAERRSVHDDEIRAGEAVARKIDTPRRFAYFRGTGRNKNMRVGRTLSFIALALAALVYRAPLDPAHALDKVHAGTAVALWAFLPLQIGQEQGIWQKYGIDLDITNNGSDAKLQQALTAGSIDFGLGSGAAMAFAAKGSPVHAVAAFAEEPKTVTIIVAEDSPVKGPADLKGKLVVMPGVGSVSEWLVWQMAIQQGWGKDGIRTAGQGSIAANIAAIKTHQADAMTGPPEVGYLLEKEGEGHVAFSLAQFAPHFHAHIDLRAQRPYSEQSRSGDALPQRLLRGHRLYEDA